MIENDVYSFLRQALERLIATYRDLAAAHRAFLENPEGVLSADGIANLLDQREVSFAIARDLEKEISDTLADRLSKEAAVVTNDVQNIQNLANIAKLLTQILPDGAHLVEQWRMAVSELVETDRAVQAALNRARDELASEIKKIRRGANLLKGYLQPDETGSCFIDKIK